MYRLEEAVQSDNHVILAQEPMSVYSGASPHIRCVLVISAHVQVTVGEMEREKERAVQEKQNVIQQMERVIRNNEQWIQTLLVCAYMYNVRLILRRWEWLVGGARNEHTGPLTVLT